MISREKASPTHRRGWLNLRRITSGSSWIPEIDGLRFIAIVLVVLYHLSAQIFAKGDVSLTMQPWYAGIFALLGRGDIGVRIFFVISGFILGRPFARHYLLGHLRPSLSTYYLRRLTRLEPPYLINIAVCAISIMLYAHTPLRAVFPPFAASAFYLHDFFFRGRDFINPVAWTLEMEVQFYLLVPLLTVVYLLRNRWLRRSLLGTFCIALPAALESLVFGKISGTSHFWATIGWWLQYFLAGMLLSDIYVTEIPTWRASWLWDVVSGAAWCVLLSGISRLYPLEPLLIALAFIGAFRGVLLHRLFTIDWLAIVGGMCYSLYLWHFFIIALVFKVSRRVLITHDLLVNFLIQSALILPCILGFSVLYFVFIERPCMDPAWPQKLKTAVSGHSRRSEVA